MTAGRSRSGMRWWPISTGALQEELAGSAWAGSCISWYKTAENRITNNWPGPVEAYKAQTSSLNLKDFDFLQQAEMLEPSGG